MPITGDHEGQLCLQGAQARCLGLVIAGHSQARLKNGADGTGALVRSSVDTVELIVWNGCTRAASPQFAAERTSERKRRLSLRFQGSSFRDQRPEQSVRFLGMRGRVDGSRGLVGRPPGQYTRMAGDPAGALVRRAGRSFRLIVSPAVILSTLALEEAATTVITNAGAVGRSIRRLCGAAGLWRLVVALTDRLTCDADGFGGQVPRRLLGRHGVERAWSSRARPPGNRYRRAWRVGFRDISLLFAAWLHVIAERPRTSPRPITLKGLGVRRSSSNRVPNCIFSVRPKPARQERGRVSDASGP